MKHRKGAAVAAAGILLAAGVSGCSSGEPGGEASAPAPTATAEPTPNGVQKLEAEKILDRARTAAESAESVKAQAIPAGADQPALDIQVSANGSQGSFESAGAQQQVIVNSDGVYIKGTDDYFRGFLGDEALATVTGKWLKVPSSDSRSGEFAAFQSVDAFVATALRTDSRTFKKVAPKVCETGTGECVGVEAERGTLWVATEGEPYPASLQQKGEAGTLLTFSEWNAPVTITPPAEGEFVDISQVEPSQSPSPTDTESPSPTSS